MDTGKPNNETNKGSDAIRKHLSTLNKGRQALWKDTKEKLRDVRFLVEVATLIAVVVYADIAYNTMRIDQRPWIAIEHWDGHIDPDKPYWINIAFANVGKSPALDFKVVINYIILPKDQVFTKQDIVFRGERRDLKEFNTWYPGTLNTLPGPWIPKFYFEEKISRKDWEQLMSKGKTFYFFEKATYRDIFNRRMESHFCTYYLSVENNPPPTACKIYNDVKPEE
jgi:hypothetical protein